MDKNFYGTCDLGSQPQSPTGYFPSPLPHPLFSKINLPTMGGRPRKLWSTCKFVTCISSEHLGKISTNIFCSFSWETKPLQCLQWHFLKLVYFSQVFLQCLKFSSQIIFWNIIWESFESHSKTNFKSATCRSLSFVGNTSEKLTPIIRLLKYVWAINRN